MAYAATALAFMLENLGDAHTLLKADCSSGKPVVVTGAMVPFADVHNDARPSLILSDPPNMPPNSPLH